MVQEEQLMITKEYLTHLKQLEAESIHILREVAEWQRLFHSIDKERSYE